MSPLISGKCFSLVSLPLTSVNIWLDSIKHKSNNVIPLLKTPSPPAPDEGTECLCGKLFTDRIMLWSLLTVLITEFYLDGRLEAALRV